MRLTDAALRHDCDLPSLDDVPTYPLNLDEIGARHRCEVCGQKWRAVYARYHLVWRRSGEARRRWLRAERKRREAGSGV